jgi:hypothetical protein
MESEFTYWYIEYISCEGNERWTIARTPSDWDDWQVRDRISSMRGSIGDDPAEVREIFTTYDNDFSWDFT